MSNTHPQHYAQFKNEPIDIIEEWGLNFNLGNALKYIARAGHKDDMVQDLEKAVYYINYEIEKIKKCSKDNNQTTVLKEMLNI